MGYIEDLRDKRLEEFKDELLKKKEESPEEILFNEDFSIFNFSCGLKDGYKMFNGLNKLIKYLKNRRRQMIAKINELCSSLKIEPVDGRNLSKKDKKEFTKGIKNILLELTTEDSKRIKQLEKMKRNILLRIGNLFLYVLTISLSFGFGGLLYLNNKIVNAIVYPVSILCILGFVALQVIYTVKYLKAIKSTLRGIIVFSIKRTFSAGLVVWLYSFIVTYVNTFFYENTLALQLVFYNFAAIFVLYVIFMIYDLFLSSYIFDERESTISLIAAIIIGLVSFTDLFKYKIVTQISSIFLLMACLLLTLLIIKKFLFDKQSLKDFMQVSYIALITVVTITLTIVALYRLLWVSPLEGQVADNTLFSAVVGVYAAFIGGGLTLTGVAWTIKHSEKQRKNDEKLRVRPYIVLEKPTPDIFYYELPLANDIGSAYKTCFPQLPMFISDNADCIFVGLIIKDTFFPAVTELFMQKNSRHATNLLKCQELIETEKLFVIIKDLLDNFYKYECLLKKRDDSNNEIIEYDSYEFSAPLPLTDDDMQIIQNRNGAN